MSNGKFGTSICCMDGRIQIPLNTWIKKHHLVDYVDTITEPGIEKKISTGENLDQIKSKTAISINKHNSTVVVISAHHDCAGNPVSKEEHIIQVKNAIEKIKEWNFPAQVIGVWVNDRWEIEKID